jgi:hypothetical protein
MTNDDTYRSSSQLALYKIVAVALEHSRCSSPGPRGCAVKNGLTVKVARVLEVVALSLHRGSSYYAPAGSELLGLKTCLV